MRAADGDGLGGGSGMKRSRSPSGVLAPQRASPTLRRLFLSSLEEGGGKSHISAQKKKATCTAIMVCASVAARWAGPRISLAEPCHPHGLGGWALFFKPSQKLRTSRGLSPAPGEGWAAQEELGEEGEESR